MTIGIRLQKARARAGLTQEQAAELLNVSRQTISNWENDKTIPDVACAKEISRIYCVSLDALVMEAEPVEIQTVEGPAVENKTELGSAFLKVYFGIWLFCVLIFWILKGLSGLAMLYAIVVVGIFFPACTGIMAFLFGLFDCWPNKGFFFVILCGTGQMLLPYLTYSVANTIASGNINPLDWPSFATGFVVGAVSMVLGGFVNWITDVLSDRLGSFAKKAE